MPIKRTGVPTLFVPQLNVYAKALVLVQFNWMTRYFTMAHKFDSQKTYVDVYYREVVKEQKMEEANFELFEKKYPDIASATFSNVLKYLRQELADSRQRSYCREIFNRMALHISNAIGDRVITNMLDKFIDEEVDVILSDNYKPQNLKTAKQINVRVAGTLSSLIIESERYEIEHLILTGYLNGADIKFLRTIIDYSGNFGYQPPLGKLSYLNLENVNIVEGGDPYFEMIEKIRGVDVTKLYYTEKNTVSDYMFYSTALQSIILPKSITSIGDEAFSECSLKSIFLPENVTSLGEYVFSCCRELSAIDIPSKVSVIGNGIFQGCDSLNVINCKNPIPPQCDEHWLLDWNDNPLDIVERAKLYVPKGSSMLYKTSSAWKYFNNIIEQ